MSVNSLREQIIVANKTIVEALFGITTVTRTVQEYSELQNFAVTQFPVVAIVGRVPVPKSKRTGRNGQVDLILSELNVDFYCYLMNNEEIDTAISSLLDDLWVALYSDQTRGGLVMTTEVTADNRIEYLAPFAAFRLTVLHTYKHGPGGI